MGSCCLGTVGDGPGYRSRRWERDTDGGACGRVRDKGYIASKSGGTGTGRACELQRAATGVMKKED